MASRCSVHVVWLNDAAQRIALQRCGCTAAEAMNITRVEQHADGSLHIFDSAHEEVPLRRSRHCGNVAEEAAAP